MRALAGGAAALALLVLFLAFGAAGGVAQDDAPAETFRVELASNGDAEWIVTMRFELDSPNETAGFDRLADEFEAGDSDVLSVGPYRQAAEQAGRATDRSMEIENVSRRAWRANETGRLELSFVWTSFARQASDRLLLGDVFQTETGTWFPGLDEDQALIVQFPDGYVIVNSSHKLENRAFEIRGPTTFEPGMPSATLVRGQTTTTAPGTTVVTTVDTTESPTTNTTTTEPPTRGDWDVIGVGALVVLIGTLALLVERRRRSGEGAVSADGGDGDVSGGRGATEAVAAGSAAGAEDGAADAGSEPLLSDDERVLRLLHRNDGRMKQGQIVEETGWSNAKVSQLLSEMAEEDRVDKLRIGRENLISLPGEGPDGDE